MSQAPLDGTRQYRRGAVMGLTVAEVFLLLAFTLLMLMLLWRSEDEAKLAAVKDFAEMSGSEQAEVVDIHRTFSEAGIVPTNPALREKLEVFLDLEGSEAGQLLLQEIAAIDEPDRRRLVELVEDESLRADIEVLKTRIRDQLALASDAGALIVGALEVRLGPVVREAGGAIQPDGSLVFPDTVLFERGSAAITPALRQFLGSICEPWFATLRASGTPIGELRIEGHASSEWDAGTAAETAYLLNLALSQARAHAVLSTCFELVPGATGAWARERATAIGFSSSRPVLGLDGGEDRAKSRRVIFGVTFDQDRVLDAIGDEAAGPTPDPPAGTDVEQGFAPPTTAPQETAPPGSDDEVGIEANLIKANASGAEEASGEDGLGLVGVASVIDADTIEIHGARIRLHGIDAPESRQLCLDVAGSAFRCGQAAALALADRVGRGTIACEARGEDRYGRIIALCRQGTDPRSGIDLGAWMVEEGLAYACRRYSEDYVTLEDAARSAGRGFWAGQFEPPWEQR